MRPFVALWAAKRQKEPARSTQKQVSQRRKGAGRMRCPAVFLFSAFVFQPLTALSPLEGNTKGPEWHNNELNGRRGVHVMSLKIPQRSSFSASLRCQIRNRFKSSESCVRSVKPSSHRIEWKHSGTTDESETFQPKRIQNSRPGMVFASTILKENINHRQWSQERVTKYAHGIVARNKFFSCESCEKWSFFSACEWINSHQAGEKKLSNFSQAFEWMRPKDMQMSFLRYLKRAKGWLKGEALSPRILTVLALTLDKYRLWTRGKNYMLMAFTQKRGWTGLEWREKCSLRIWIRGEGQT